MKLIFSKKLPRIAHDVRFALSSEVVFCSFFDFYYIIVGLKGIILFYRFDIIVYQSPQNQERREHFLKIVNLILHD